jgi:hypothetical protein
MVPRFQAALNAGMRALDIFTIITEEAPKSGEEGDTENTTAPAPVPANKLDPLNAQPLPFVIGT